MIDPLMAAIIQIVVTVPLTMIASQYIFIFCKKIYDKLIENMNDDN